MIARLATLFADEPQPGVAELQGLLESIFDGPGIDGELIERQSIKGRVHRLRFDIGGQRRSIVVKRLDPDIARRDELVVKRWLPSVGLEGLAPILLGVAAEGNGSSVWHAYQDLGDVTLDRAAPDPADVERAVREIAALHTRFAGHALLGECRLWGGDLGIAFFGASVRDAASALRSLETVIDLEDPLASVRDRLLDRLSRLLEDLPRRAVELERFGGPETLLHGDLWRKNVILLGDQGGQVRLIDWDHAGVGSIVYDLSTLLARFPPPDRSWVLDCYRRAVEPAGWRLPEACRLNALFDTAEQARIANRIIWPAIAVLEGDRDWGPSALAEIEGWFDALDPLLPEGAGL